jgi:hypothetical protein
VHANTEICIHSEYGAVVSNAYIIQQVSGAGVRSVTASTMADYHDSSEFEHGGIVSARQISKVVMHWGFSHTTIL